MRKLHVAIKITEELLYDNAFNLESYIIDQFGKAIGNAEEDAFLNGDGKGKPLGILPPTAVDRRPSRWIQRRFQPMTF